MLNRIVFWVIIPFLCFFTLVQMSGPPIKRAEAARLPTPKIYTVDDMANLEYHPEEGYTPYHPRITVPPVTDKVLSQKQVECLQRNIFFESRDQSLLGQMAVAFVTVERKNHEKRWGSSICKVVYAKKQFSWTNDGQHNRKPNLKNPIERKAWERAKWVAEITMMADIDKPVLGVTHYHTTAVNPKWSRSQQLAKAVIIGDHVFYKENI